MDAVNYFARDYRAARAKFLEAADAARAVVETFENPATGPDGKTLYTDVALVGDRDCERVLLANSATHGAEGFCGSGAMVGWLRRGEFQRLPQGVRAVLVHAINPHGFAWLRRVAEDNVDLNRNFVDHDRGVYPVNPDYAALHAHILPARWDGKTREAMDAAFADYATAHGDFALQAALSRGQYDQADGVFHGGRAAGWSNRTFRDILRKFCASARHIAFLDFHTGLGPYGHAEMIARFEPDSGLGKRLKSWFGEGLTSPNSGDSSSPQLSGLIATSVPGELPEAEVTSITVEYGTYPLRRVLAAVLADNWVHLKGDLDSDVGRAIKAEMRQCFYPDEDNWKELVSLRALQIMRRAVRGLAGA